MDSHLIVLASQYATQNDPSTSSTPDKEGPFIEIDEDYRFEFNQLTEIFKVFDVTLEDEGTMWEFTKRWLSPLAPAIIAELLIPIVKDRVYVFGLKSGLTWSESAKLYLRSPPEKFTPELYFKGVLRMLALVLRHLRETFDAAMSSNLKSQPCLKKMKCFHTVILTVYAKCSQVTFKDHVCKELMERLIIKRVNQIQELLQHIPTRPIEELAAIIVVRTVKEWLDVMVQPCRHSNITINALVEQWNLDFPHDHKKSFEMARELKEAGLVVRRGLGISTWMGSEKRNLNCLIGYEWTGQTFSSSDSSLNTLTVQPLC